MQRPRRKPRSRSVTAMLWGVLLPACGVVGLGWLLGGWVYGLDLIAAMQAQLCVLMGLVALLGLVLGRWRFVAVIVALLGSGLLPIVQGRALMLPSAGEAKTRADTIRIVSVNINPTNERLEEDLELVMGLDADVLVLIEVPPRLSRAIRRRGLLEDSAYPFWAHRAWVDEETSPGFVLSRWPVQIVEDVGDDAGGQHVLHARVDRPGGAFIAGLVHPLSPRTRSRWESGNEVVGVQATAAARTMGSFDLPLILGADLNAGPAQYRARVLRRSGLRQCKPLLRLGGSYPSDSGLPDVLRMQLDDVWWMGDLRVLAWAMIDVPGSDHKAVVVDFALGSY